MKIVTPKDNMQAVKNKFHLLVGSKAGPRQTCVAAGDSAAAGATVIVAAATAGEGDQQHRLTPPMRSEDTVYHLYDQFASLNAEKTAPHSGEPQQPDSPGRQRKADSSTMSEISEADTKEQVARQLRDASHASVDASAGAHTGLCAAAGTQAPAPQLRHDSEEQPTAPEATPDTAAAPASKLKQSPPPEAGKLPYTNVHFPMSPQLPFRVAGTSVLFAFFLRLFPCRAVAHALVNLVLSFPVCCPLSSAVFNTM